MNSSDKTLVYSYFSVVGLPRGDEGDLWNTELTPWMDDSIFNATLAESICCSKDTWSTVEVLRVEDYEGGKQRVVQLRLPSEIVFFKGTDYEQWWNLEGKVEMGRRFEVRDDSRSAYPSIYTASPAPYDAVKFAWVDLFGDAASSPLYQGLIKTAVSKFLRGTKSLWDYTLSSRSISVATDGKGAAVINPFGISSASRSPSLCDGKRPVRAAVLVLYVHSLLMALAKLNGEIQEAGLSGDAEKMKRTLEKGHRFLLAYGEANPVKVTNNETSEIYGELSRRAQIESQLAATETRLKHLKDLWLLTQNSASPKKENKGLKAYLWPAWGIGLLALSLLWTVIGLVTLGVFD